MGTLWGERERMDRMDKNVRKYIRDCFLKELKEQLEQYPVIILEYDGKHRLFSLRLTKLYNIFMDTFVTSIRSYIVKIRWVKKPF